ncbi:MAG: zf-HC2 domain-containing protein [Candidatus Marinimicrobia bacterium]|nr:zf-HC2 domain-containing protein [Candidatus Neomarinimicrobiota bacterium]
MNCYNFEENISVFIESDLSLKLRKEFIQHRETCPGCEDKLNGIVSIINSFKQIESVATSTDFVKNLHQRIDKYNSRKEPLFTRLLNFQPFGLKPVAALGFVTAFTLLTISSFLLFQDDNIPKLNVSEFSQKPSTLSNQAPLMVNSQQVPAVKDSTRKDSLRDASSRFDDQILMVNQKENK